MAAADHDHARFAAMFHELSPRVFAYARRQCDASSAQDVVSETFLTAWRRRADVPEMALPWPLVVARNMIANRRRGEHRRDRLAETIAQLAQVAGPGADHAVVERDVMLTALAELSDLEREAVLLIAWEAWRTATRQPWPAVRCVHSKFPEWTAQRQDDVLAAIIDDAQPVSSPVRIPLVFTKPRHRPRRIGIAASVVALTAVAAAVVVIVAGGGGGGGSNAPTHQPTGRNRFWNPPPGRSDQALPKGKYSYRVIDMLARFPGRTLITGVDRSYVAASGEIVSFRSGNDTGCYRFPDVYAGFSEPTKAFFAALPTDPDELNKYMRSHVSGSTSRDEAVFVAVGDALHTADALASPKLRAAFLAVLSRTPGVTVFEGRRDDLNHPAIRADFVDQANRPGEVQSLYFDPTTFQLTEEGGGSNGQPTTGKEQFPPYNAHPKPGVDPVRLRHRGGQVMRIEQVVDSIPQCRHPKR